mgnify:CR=1 FL=1
MNDSDDQIEAEDDVERSADAGPDEDDPEAEREGEGEDHPGADETDEDGSDEEHEAAASEAAPARRRSLGPTLFVLGAGLWVVAGALRCSAPKGPTAAIDVDAPEVAVADDEAPGDDDDDDHVAVAPPAPVPAADDVSPIPEEEEDAEDELAPVAPADWAAGAPAPDTVTYTIRRGGSAKNVANLFKIFHHEMTELNPGVDLDAELAPGTSLVVYRRPSDGVSESVGAPSAGSLVGGVPMMSGRGRELKMIPWKSYATAHTVSTLDKILDQWAARGHAQPVLVGNMSARDGGRLEPHSTHQSGRDVDISYIQRLPKGEELNWREMTQDNLDAAETWALLELLRESGTVEMVFIDRAVQKLLYDWAVEKGGKSKGQLKRWMEYPRNGPVTSAFIQHVPGHVDHIHVRFDCPKSQARCISKSR